MRATFSILLAALASGAGCRTVAYYSQAVAGQCQMLVGQEPIATMVDDPNVSPDLRRQLQLVLKLRLFARDELKMNPAGNYLRYRELDRKFALWVVYAAPEFDTELKSWWYPVVGRFTTRGFFKESAARAYAKRLEEQALDVYVGGAPAYSTLGWFDDPVLSTFINYSETELADLIFHELAHHHLFLPGDATFNESFATAVAEIGVARWLEAHHDAVKQDEYLAHRKQAKQFNEMLFQSREELQKTYAQDQTDDQKRNAKARIIVQLKSRIMELSQADPSNKRLANWSQRPINNALLGATAVYYHQVPAFIALFEKSNRDFAAFFAAVKNLTQLNQEKREAMLQVPE